MNRKVVVNRDETSHTGPACYRSHRGGRVTVLCPYGHFVDTVGPGQWATSSWAMRASWGHDVVTCRGALKPDAEPYPFPDTFLGRGGATS